MEVTLLIVLLSIQIVLLLFFGYVLYVTNVKIEEYKENLKKIEKTILSDNALATKQHTDIIMILKKLVENV